MKRVGLIVTGDVEELALHESLRRLFPTVDFARPQRGPSFTSNTLRAAPDFDARIPPDVEELARALVFAVDPGREREAEPYDLAVLVDDLELVNAACPERAVAYVREAVRLTIERAWSSAERRRRAHERVRERCSFHLFAPMVEAYFFGERAADRGQPALARAGAQRRSLFDPTACDLEDFHCLEPDYLDPADASRYWAKGERVKHPKRYLQFLCDPEGRNRRQGYQETKGGRQALRSLDWGSVLAPAEHARFARSFILDLAEALGEHQVAAKFAGERHPLTSRQGRENVLRNI